MKTATTATANTAKTIPVEATGRWTFTRDTIALDGHEFAASYSVAAKNRDVFAYVNIGDAAIRLHVAAASPLHDAAFDAAMAAKQPAKQAAANPEAKPTPAAKQPAAEPATKPAKQAAPKYEPKHVAKAAPAAKQPETEKAAKPAKQAAPKYEPKHVAKAAPAAKQPAAEPAAKPAKQAEPAGKGWIGTAITGKGWTIAFDEATQRTRVSFTSEPSAKQKAAVEAAGFYFSAQLKSWNKKLTCKAYRAAQTLAATLTAIA